MPLRFIFVLLIIPELATTQVAVRKFVQISDIHLDIEYVDGGDVTNLCHKANTTLAESEGGASKYGDYRCDSPKKLFLSSIKYLRTQIPDPDFIIWSGDSSPHWTNDTTKHWDNVYNNLKIITKELHKAFPDTMIIPALGNHDSFPADSFPDPGIDPGASKIYSGFIEEGALGDLLRDPDARSTFLKCGYYTLKKPNYFGNITQTFIVLNTNLYYNNKAGTDSTDPCGQFQWLRTQLKNSTADERVFIIAHVPPGYFELSPTVPFFNNDNFTQTYVDIVTDKKIAKRIVGHFYGHTHTDALRFFTSDEAVINVGFVAPSVTPLMFEGGVNPSVRIYDYSPETRTILDYETHYLPLDKLIVRSSSKDSTEVPSDEQSDPPNGSNFSVRSKRQDELVHKPVVKKMTGDNDTFEDLSTEPSMQTTVAFNQSTIESDAEEVASATSSPHEETTLVTEDKSMVENQTTDSDPVVDFLVKQWIFGYSKRKELNITDLSSRVLYKAYIAMKKDRHGSKFKVFHRQTWVMHDPENMDCDEVCHTTFMCTMVKFTTESFSKCTEQMSKAKIDSVSTSSTRVTSSVYTKISITESTTRSRPLPAKPSETVDDSGEDSPSSESNVVSGIAIGFTLIVIIAVAGFIFAFYRRTRMSRYRSQEFLLTDSVFRYDGYAQVDQP